MIILHLKSYLNVDPLDVGLFLHKINTLLKCVKYLHQHFTVKSIYKLNARHLGVLPLNMGTSRKERMGK
jgi:hypothetical protein